MKNKFDEINIERTPDSCRMNRGRYKGKLISTLETWYLKWVAENWSENTPEDKLICRLADQEYQERKRNGDE